MRVIYTASRCGKSDGEAIGACVKFSSKGQTYDKDHGSMPLFVIKAEASQRVSFVDEQKARGSAIQHTFLVDLASCLAQRKLNSRKVILVANPK